MQSSRKLPRQDISLDDNLIEGKKHFKYLPRWRLYLLSSQWNCFLVSHWCSKDTVHTLQTFSIQNGILTCKEKRGGNITHWDNRHVLFCGVWFSHLTQKREATDCLSQHRKRLSSKCDWQKETLHNHSSMTCRLVHTSHLVRKSENQVEFFQISN